MELRDQPFRQGDELDAGEDQLLVEARDMLLVPRDAVQRLGNDDVEGALPRILQELLVPRAQIGCAGKAPVGIDMARCPACSASGTARQVDGSWDWRVSGSS